MSQGQRPPAKTRPTDGFAHLERSDAQRCPRSQELARMSLRIIVPYHGHDLTWIDHSPPVLALKTDQAVRPNLHAGQLIVLGHRESHRPDPADEHGNRPRLTDEGLKQIAHRLAGHEPSPPGIERA